MICANRAPDLIRSIAGTQEVPDQVRDVGAANGGDAPAGDLIKNATEAAFMDDGRLGPKLHNAANKANVRF